MVVGYATRGDSTYPVARMSASNEREARTVAASMAARGVGSSFEIIRDGRAKPLKLDEKRGFENHGSQGTKCTFRTGPAARRIHAGKSAALAG